MPKAESKSGNTKSSWLAPASKSEERSTRDGASAGLPAEHTHSIHTRVASAASREWNRRASRARSGAPEAPLMATPLAAWLSPKWMTSAPPRWARSTGLK